MEAGSTMANSSTRVLFYSHDTFGLGHIRRTLAISGAVSQELRDAAVLVATGSSWVPSLRLPPAVDYVKLPCVTKVGDNHYEAKTLAVEFDTIRSVRESILFATTTSFAPHWVFVDNVPLGMKGEMVHTLRYVREKCRDTRVILTLRDVLDEPERIVRDWTSASVYEAIDHFYDRVMVYGSRNIFDVAREYGFPDTIAHKVAYAGYIRSTASADTVRQLRRRYAPKGERLVLVTVGGGGDGYLVVDTYLRGLAALDRVPTRTLVVLGPEMPEHACRQLQARSTDDPRVTLVDFSPDLASYVAAADAVVSMGGYNTICEILSFRKPSVIVPRVEPRLEQWIRCQRLAALGLVTILHPSAVTPERLMSEVERLLTPATRPHPDMPLNLNGLNAVAEMVRVGSRS
jgi:predicted glycosyltransferase